MALFSQTLRQAYFNSVPFHVTAGSLTFGRRAVVHEYPQRDEPFVEDLGRATRNFTLTGFLIGDTAVALSRRLISEVEKASADNAPVALVHPWLGRLKVRVTTAPTMKWDLHRRLCTFELAFIEAGAEKYPSQLLSWADRLKLEADNLLSKVIASFGVTWDEIEWATDTISNLATGSYGGILGAFETSRLNTLFNLGDAVADLVDTAVADLNLSGTQFALKFANALGLGGYVNSVRNWREVAKSAADLYHDKKLKPVTDTSSSVATVESSSEMAAETAGANALTSLARAVTLSNMAGAAALVGTTLDADEDENDEITRSDTDVRALRNELMTALETEMIAAGTDDQDVYETLEWLHTALYQTMTAEVLHDGDTVELEVNEGTPAVVLAYDRYEDASRVEELTRRNDIVNPLFTPVGTVLMRSR